MEACHAGVITLMSSRRAFLRSWAAEEHNESCSYLANFLLETFWKSLPRSFLLSKIFGGYTYCYVTFALLYSYPTTILAL